MRIAHMVSINSYNTKEQAITGTGHCKNTNKIGMVPKDSSISEIENAVENGKTIVCGDFDHGKPFEDEFFKGQQMYMVDIDNNEDCEVYAEHEEILQLLESIDIKPSFVYETFQSNAKRRKYRYVFILKEPVNSVKESLLINKSFRNVFTIKGIKIADNKCSDLGRLYYGTYKNRIIYRGHQNIVKKEKLFIAAQGQNQLTDKQKVSIQSSPVTVTADNSSEFSIVQALIDKDVDKYRNALSAHILNLGNRCKFSNIVSSSYGGDIKSFDFYYLKDLISRHYSDAHKLCMPTGLEDIYTLTSDMPLEILLGLPLNQNFNCILPCHDDEHPSARIQTHQGKRYYICYSTSCLGTSKPVDTFGIFERLLNLEDKQETITFIEKALGIDPSRQTHLQKQKTARVLRWKEYFESDTFMKDQPLIYNKLKRHNAHKFFPSLLEMIETHISTSDLAGVESSKTIVFFSLKYISQWMNFNHPNLRGLSTAAIQKKIQHLVQFGLIDKIPEDEIPSNALSKALAYSKREGYKYRTEFYSLPDYQADLFLEVESNIRTIEKKSIRSKAQSFQQAKQSYGLEKAQKLYTQEENLKNDPALEKFYGNYRINAFNLLRNDGYINETQLLKKIGGYSTKYKSNMSGVLLPRLITELQLIKKRVNKRNRAVYSIDDSIPSNSFVFILDDE